MIAILYKSNILDPELDTENIALTLDYHVYIQFLNMAEM